MRLLEITRSFYPSVGGLEKFLSDRLKIYKSLGIEYTVLSTTYSNKKRDEFLKDDETIFVKQYTAFNYTPQIKNYFKNDYDIISINQLGRYFSHKAINHYNKLGKKIIITPHFAFHTSRNRLIKKIYNLLFIKRLLKRCTIIVCFTEHEKKYWHITYNIPYDKLVVIPHYYDSDVDKRLNSKRDGKYFFYLGRAAKNKRTDLLISAFHLLKKRDYNLKLTIDYDDLSKESQKIVNIDKRIELLGYISEVDKNTYLENCTALIYPSEYEAFGHVLLEASRFLKPIICSSLEIFTEILDPKGVVYFENSIDGIVDAMEKFIRLEESVKIEMGIVNHQHLQKYSFINIQKKYADLFKNL